VRGIVLQLLCNRHQLWIIEQQKTRANAAQHILTAWKIQRHYWQMDTFEFGARSHIPQQLSSSFPAQQGVP